MRSFVVAVVLGALVLVGCSSGAPSPSPTTNPPATSTSPPPELSISAQHACGPTDGAYLDVRVEGANPAELVADLVIDGRIVAAGAGPGTQEGTIGIDLQHADLRGWEQGQTVEVRRGTTLPVLATDEDIAPRAGGGCG
jgi:hypothetical protein